MCHHHIQTLWKRKFSLFDSKMLCKVIVLVVKKLRLINYLLVNDCQFFQKGRNSVTINGFIFCYCRYYGCVKARKKSLLPSNEFVFDNSSIDEQVKSSQIFQRKLICNNTQNPDKAVCKLLISLLFFKLPFSSSTTQYLLSIKSRLIIIDSYFVTRCFCNRNNDVLTGAKGHMPVS